MTSKWNKLNHTFSFTIMKQSHLRKVCYHLPKYPDFLRIKKDITDKHIWINLSIVTIKAITCIVNHFFFKLFTSNINIYHQSELIKYKITCWLIWYTYLNSVTIKTSSIDHKSCSNYYIVITSINNVLNI